MRMQTLLSAKVSPHPVNTAARYVCDHGAEEEDIFESDFESTDEEEAQEDVDATAEKLIRQEESRVRKVADHLEVVPFSILSDRPSLSHRQPERSSNASLRLLMLDKPRRSTLQLSHHLLRSRRERES